MNVFSEIFEITETIRKNFEALEAETNAILSCPPEDIEAHTENRVNYLEENKKLYDEIFAFCAVTENGEELKGAVKNTAEREQLSEDFRKVFDGFQEVYAIVHRVVNIDSQVTERIERERERILEQIKNMNEGQEAKAAKFYAASQSGSEMHVPDTKRSV